MALFLRLLLLAAGSFLLLSCASESATVPSPQWSFEREAIHLRLAGDRQLNLFQDTPHALVSCLYQLRDPNAFNQAAGEADGLARLLECGRFDPSVASARRIVLQPRQELDETLDRAEGARYLGYVAGYYRSRAERSVRLLSIPVAQESGGFLWLSTSTRPAAVDLDLRLGPEGILTAGAKK